ncbi:hypothetical protein R2B67_15450 [Streptomyces cyaneofuscatus]|nr:hypothetical protein [Streptomyces cyaneofuscatus]WOP09868.1 hypothetical protein R2B67_15450 [Streptomyces cyaneofuscatus]
MTHLDRTVRQGHKGQDSPAETVSGETVLDIPDGGEARDREGASSATGA